MVRLLDSALKIDGKNIEVIETRVCLKITKASPPSNGRLSLTCREGKSCVAPPTDSIVVSCGAPGNTARLRLSDLIPSAMAQVSTSARLPAGDRPAPGDWLIPQIDSLRERRGTPQAKAFSEVQLTLKLPAPAPTRSPTKSRPTAAACGSKALCAWMSQPDPARRLMAKGFAAPSTFRVREIALESNNAPRRTPSVECSRFGAS